MQLIGRQDSALLVIDLQTEFYSSHRRDVNRAQLAKVADNIAWLGGVANALHVPAVVTEEDPEENGRTEPAIIEALSPATPVLSKVSFGAAWQPDILAVIAALGKKTIVLVGAETDICVTHSALGLQDAGYRVVVVVDAVYSPGDAHEHGLRRLAAAGVDLLSAKQVLYDWLPRLAQIREFQQSHPELARPVHFST